MINTVVVTGAGSGIGLDIVKRLSEENYHLFSCTRNDSEELLSLSKKRDNITLFKFDLEDRSSIKDMVKDNLLFGLVNCAGVAHGGLFSMTPIEDIEKVFRTNYFNQLYLTQLILKKLVRNKSGSVINIASTAGLFADEGTLAYGGSKAALVHSTRVLASELGKFNIRVNSISPAVVNTKMSLDMDKTSLETLNSRKSIGGIIEPQDISSVVSFLLSEQTKNISGQNFRVDQGMVI
jgi:3-oxoacyl-[acyl-carrier protein] reductase